MHFALTDETMMVMSKSLESGWILIMLFLGMKE
jgi:hypothetical protein